MPTVPSLMDAGTGPADQWTMAPGGPGPSSAGGVPFSPGGAVRAAGDLYGGYASFQAGLANEQISNQNADLLDLQAQDAITRGYEAEARLRRQVAGLIGQQRAGYGNQGVDVNTGSAATVQADTRAQGEQDAMTLRNNAALEAWALRNRANQSRAQGEQAAAAGRQAAIGSGIQAVGSILG